MEISWLLEKMKARVPMTLVDARPKRAKYDKGHIPGAVSIPARQFDKFKDRLPKDKKALLVFYCGGYT